MTQRFTPFSHLHELFLLPAMLFLLLCAGPAPSCQSGLSSDDPTSERSSQTTWSEAALPQHSPPHTHNILFVSKNHDLKSPSVDYLIVCISPPLVAQSVKNLPAMQETQVWSLGSEDPLEQGMTTHSSILAWRSPMDRGAWQAIVHGVARVRHDLGE